MTNRQDILFAKIAIKNQLLSLDQIKKCMEIQGELEKIGVRKSISLVFLENGLLVEEDIARLNKAVVLSEQILYQKLAQQKFFQELDHRKEELVDSVFKEEAWDKPPTKSTVSPLPPLPAPSPPPSNANPFEMDTEEFRLSPEGELEAVMLLQKIKKAAPQGKEQIEERFGKFKILSKLGQGGQSEVFHAIDTTTKKDVAIKIIKPDTAKDKAFIERFHREARHLKKFNHPNIIKIYDAGMIHDKHYLAMEYVKGETLADRASRGSLSIPESCEIIKQISQGLMAAHEKLIIHRDIKMSNVLLTTDASKYGFEMEGDPNFKVKIADFGLARSKKDTKVTQANQFMGTAKYLSPEQIQHGEVSEKSDIFALGVIAYELLSGKEPFPATSSIGYLHANVELIPEPIREFNSNVSLPLETAVFKMLEKDPEERYAAPALIRDWERLEKAFWGNQRIYEYQDEESAFYMGSLEERKKRIRKIIYLSIIAILLVSIFIVSDILLNQYRFKKGSSLVDSDPQASMQILKESLGWGVSSEEVESLIQRARLNILQKALKTSEEENKWERVSQLCQKIIQEFPDQKKILAGRLHYAEYMQLFVLAVNLESTNLLESVKIYRKAIALAPEQKVAKANLEALLLKVQLDIQKYRDLRQFDQAHNSVKLWVQMDPSKKDLAVEEVKKIQLQESLLKIQSLESKLEWMEAMRECQEAIRLQKSIHPQDFEKIKQLENRIEKARISFLFHLHHKRGLEAEKAGNFKEAAEAYKKALYIREDRILREKLDKILEKLSKD